MTRYTRSGSVKRYKDSIEQGKTTKQEKEEGEGGGSGGKDERITLDDTFYVFVFIASASYVVRYEKVFSYIKEEVHI